MGNVNYSKINEITVHNQAELDDVPLDFKGRIYIDCTATVRVSNKYYWSVVARENSSVEAWGNSSVEARENSSVEARENSSVEARGNSSVVARENSSVVARENSSVVAWGNSSVVARENSSVVARGNSSVVAWENSSVVAWENSSVEAWGNSSVEARENSSVVARGNSSVVAWENSSVVANANVQVVNRLINGKIKLSGNAREVFMPKTIFEFMDFYGIKHTKTKAIFYKAVRKSDEEKLYADHDNNFIYTVGKYKTEPDIDTDTSADCGKGIHISSLNWALNFGKEWDNMTIIEVETKIDDIVFPEGSDGKVRTSKVKVLREIPLEECGLYGKMLAKRRKVQS